MTSRVEQTHRGSCELVGGDGAGGEIGGGGFSSSLSISKELLEGLLLRIEEEDAITTKSDS